ncbi:MAG: PAC2 family protein [Promethearchaeota archaeon]
MKPIQVIEKFNTQEIKRSSSAICVIGMPGVADIGKFAIDQLIGLFNAKKIYDILFYGYPAGVIIDKSIISTPKAEIFYWKDSKNKNDMIFITADAQPMNPREIYELSDFLVEFLTKFNISLIVSLAGYPVQINRVLKPKVYITATSDEYLDNNLKEDLCEVLSKGVIIGANGLIPSLANLKYGIDGIVLLSETPHNSLINENSTDLNASLNLIKILDRLLNFSFDIDFSCANVEKMNRDLERKKKELESELDITYSKASKGEKQKVLYI